jgi:predicted nucleic acid binding AN1-type Zn finger protein
MTNPKKFRMKCYLEDCNNKIKISNFKCSYCNIFHCDKHRLPETHGCSHDFKKAHLESATLIANKMRCVAPKIDLIT